MAKSTLYSIYESMGMTLKFEHLPSNTKVEFVAALEEFSDNYDSSWQSEEVLGRMDPLETFQGTKRTISFTWVVASESQEEAKDNIAKAEQLLRMLYPSYEDGPIGNATRMDASPLFRIKFANLIADPSGSGLVGRVNGFKYSPDLDSGFFGDSDHNAYAQTIKLSCEFTVFHTHPLGWKTQTFRQKNYPYSVSTLEDVTTETERATNQSDLNDLDAMAALDNQARTSQMTGGT